MQFRFKHLVFIGISALTLLGIGSVSGMHQSNVHADDWNTESKEMMAWANSSKSPAERFDEKDKASQDKSLAKTYKTYTYDANFYKHEPKLTNQNQYNTKYWKTVDKREHEHKYNHKKYRRTRKATTKRTRRTKRIKQNKRAKRSRRATKRNNRKAVSKRMNTYTKLLNKMHSRKMNYRNALRLAKNFKLGLKINRKRSNRDNYYQVIKQIKRNLNQLRKAY